MTWSIRLAKVAARQFSDLSPDRQKLILAHLRMMRVDPFQGDVKPLKGKGWKGRYRKRIGRYRIIFAPMHSQHIVEVSQILLRSEKTYR
jgi:mRNA-degrading endonuclease RelE of RelBE toxin-antitoxin system